MRVIVWFSRHPPLEKQRQELARLFPGSRLLQDPETFRDADDIVRRYREKSGSEMVIVAPLSLVAKLIERGIKPLWPDMREVPAEYLRAHQDSCVTAPRGRVLEFVRFRRLVGIDMQFEELNPTAE